jgi:hypothetical protein
VRNAGLAGTLGRVPDPLRQRDFLSYHLGRGLSPLGAAILPVVLACGVLGQVRRRRAMIACDVVRRGSRTARSVAAVDVRG